MLKLLLMVALVIGVVAFVYWAFDRLSNRKTPTQTVLEDILAELKKNKAPVDPMLQPDCNNKEIQPHATKKK